MTYVRGSRPITVVALAAAFIVSLSGLVAPAIAAPADQMLVSANPENNTPRIIKPAGGPTAKAMALVRVGNTVIVGGQFTQVREAGATAPLLTRTGLFAFNSVTGQIDPNFNPVLAGADGKPVVINSLAVSPDGTSLYVGGEFRTINGSGPARLQAIRLSDGQQDAAFANAAPNKSVFDLKLVGNRLYVAGSFTKIGATARSGLASLDPATGAVTTAVTTAFAGTNNGGITTVRKVDVTPSGDRLVAIGNFSSVGGLARGQVAMLDTSGATATVANWSTPNFGNNCSVNFDSYLRDVDFAPDGSFFVIVTTGAWGGSTRTCDSATRYETYLTGAQSYTWIEHTGGDTFWAVEVTGPVAYVGGHFRWLNNHLTSNGNSAGPGAVAREGIGAIDTRNGLPLTWDPGRKRGIGVFDFLVTQEHLYAVSDTETWGGEKRERLAAFPFAGGTNLPQEKMGSIPGDVVQLGPDNTSDVRSRYLTGNTAPTTTIPTMPNGPETWANVRGATMIDDTVYTGWSDGTLKKRTFDGLKFGPVSNLNLNGGQFAQDIPKITSMFYDKRDGRLYFTIANTKKGNKENNDGGLFYRYFTPESGVVGALRYDQLRQASVTAIDAAHIQGAFLVGDQLHFVDKSGVLKRITFNKGGTFTGATTTVNSTLTGGWDARGVFLSSAASASAPNMLPTAAYAFDCVGLACTFNGGTSTDPDGTIATYAWSFGDTTSGNGQVAARTFAQAGSYPVQLTVTDNRGGTNSVTKNVNVAPIASDIALSASGSYTGGQKANHSWTVPAGVDSGDTMLLFVTGSTAAVPSTPTGWALVDDVVDVDTRTVVYSRVAGPGDAGAPIDVTWTAAGETKSTITVMSLAAYSGVDDVAVTEAAIELAGSARNDHTTPDVTVPADGDWVLSYWSDKNSSTTDWSTPLGQQVRAEAVPNVAAGNTRVTSVLTDDGAPAPDGPRVGLTATANGQATKATMVSIVLGTN